MRGRTGSVLVVVLGILGALAALVLGISSASLLDDRARDYKVHRARAELLARTGMERAIAAVVSGEELSVFSVPSGTGEDIALSLGPYANFGFETESSARAFPFDGNHYAVRLFDCSSRPSVLAGARYLAELRRLVRGSVQLGWLAKFARERFPDYDSLLACVPPGPAGFLDPLGRERSVNVNTAPKAVLDWALPVVDAEERGFLVESVLRARPFRGRRDWNSFLVALSLAGRYGRFLSERALNDVLNATDDRSEAPLSEWGDGPGGYSDKPGVYGLSVARARAAAVEAGAVLDARELSFEGARRRFESAEWWKAAQKLLGLEGGERTEELAADDDFVSTVRLVFRSQHYIITSLGAVIFDAPGPRGMRQVKLGVRLQAAFDAREGKLLSLRWLD